MGRILSSWLRGPRDLLMFAGLILIACLLQTHGLAAAESEENRPATAKTNTAEGESSDTQALDLTQRLLQAEAEGDIAKRSLLLAALGSESSDDPLTQSLRGQIQTDTNQWTSIAAAVDQAQSSDALDRYETQRANMPDTVVGHWQMALWCRSEGMPESFRAHLNAVLQLAPNHAEARRALNHREFGGEWMSPEQISQQREAQQRWVQSIGDHGSTVQTWAEQLLAGSYRQRKAAERSFLEYRQTSALPAVATVFHNLPAPAGIVACQWMGQQPHPDSSRVLATWALTSGDPRVRDAAIDQLRDKSRYEYVPFLLDCARTQTLAVSIPIFRRDGSLAAVRHLVARENRDRVDLQVQDEVQQSTVSPLFGDSPAVSGRALAEMTQFARGLNRMQEENFLADLRMRQIETRRTAELQRATAAENWTLARLNRAIGDTLSRATGEAPGASPAEWWQWWANYMEREQAPIKLVSMRYRRDSMQLGRSDLYRPPRHECFVAGTPVQTRRGEKAIEQIRVGDQVLSKQLVSGTLQWDNVVAVTRQEPKPIFHVATHRGNVRCTGGHLFWVSGQGWTKARDLQVGDALHALHHPAVVEAIDEESDQPTHNLITEQAHNYFAGGAELLSHDFVEQQVVPVRVPGLPLVANGP